MLITEKEEQSIDARFPSLELSTKLMIKAALRRKIAVKIINPFENCIELQKESHKQIVIKASKTELDSYMTFLLMQSKYLTKWKLKENGLLTPLGDIFSTPEEVIKKIIDFHKEYKSFVIKPDSTNYGLGILMIHSDQYSSRDFSIALKIIREHLTACFKIASQVILEEFIFGKEYRFLVVGDRCAAVAHRIPANVIGDGKSTIEQLIAKKNEDPRRGRNHQKSLQIIEIDWIVKKALKEKKFTLDSILSTDEQVFLRENSNVSTGGESYDVTDQMSEEYKELAVQAAQSLGSKLCGVDIIINDSPSVKQKAVILELNYNPCLFIHEEPFMGQGKPVCDYVLDEIGF